MPGHRADASDARVGRNIRSLRLARNISQTALAAEIGVTFQQVQKYEKGINRVGAGRLLRIAAALHVPVIALLYGMPALDRRKTLSLLAHAPPVRLIKAFKAIEDEDLRRMLLALIEGVARLAQRRAARR
jgi:transcriptional regulator with XRE-family HTH domain